MKRLLGLVMATGLTVGFTNVTLQGAEAAALSAGTYDVVPVADQCTSYHGGYYCLSQYYAYGCIYLYGYIYCPAPPPPPRYYHHHHHYYDNGGGSDGY